MAPAPKSSARRPGARTSDALARIAEEIDALGMLDDADLRQLWVELFEIPPPRFMRRAQLLSFVAHRLQVNAFGGLTPATRRYLAGIAEASRVGEPAAVDGAPLKPGTRLVRVFEGATHTVMVAADGFEWNGTKHASLSGIARSITGTNWNGWAFFGLKRRSMRNKNAAKRQTRALGDSDGQTQTA